MTLDDFRDKLGDLLAESAGLPAEEVLSELEIQCYALRDTIEASEDEEAGFKKQS
jgi:hypothetical protein